MCVDRQRNMLTTKTGLVLLLDGIGRRACVPLRGAMALLGNSASMPDGVGVRGRRRDCSVGASD